MTRQMQFKEITLTLGFWEDADAFAVTENQWREWLTNAVRSWNHKITPHMSVASETHSQTILDQEDFLKSGGVDG